MNKILLGINDLRGGYKNDEDSFILRGISLDVYQGETVGIIGLNGSGKSTFGKAIMNMIPFRKGTIFFDGKDITSLSTSELAYRGISIMLQGGRVFKNLSVWENLQIALRDDSSYLFEIIPLLNRTKKELKHQMADKLSGGEKLQLSLGMAIATNPRLLILDEPSSGLSPKDVETIYIILDNLRKKKNVTIILIEQNIAKAVEFSDVIYIFKQGKPFRTNQCSLHEIVQIMYNLINNEEQ